MTHTDCISLDVANLSTSMHSEPIFAKQFDDMTRVIEATILEDGSAFNPGTGTTGHIRVLRPDGVSIDSICTIDQSGKLNTTLTEQMLAVDGICKADFYIEKINGERISTETFLIKVDAAPVGNENQGGGGYNPPPTPGGSVTIDGTLTKPGQAADAKATGDAINNVNDRVIELENGSSGGGTVIEQPFVFSNTEPSDKKKIWIAKEDATEDTTSATAVSAIVPQGLTASNNVQAIIDALANEIVGVDALIGGGI